jgi:uncharacterized protein
MASQAPKFLYLHGFASGPTSSKAQAFSAFFGRCGLVLDVLDLRKPSFEGLRLSELIAHVQERIGGPSDRAVLIGSSLGGLTACRVAEKDARVGALVLMAPAFGLRELWKTRLGPEKMAEWESTGFLEVDDYVARAKARVDHGFYVDMMTADPAEPADVRVPTLIVHGTKDEVVPVERSRTFAAGKAHVRLVEVEDGHDLGASIPRVLADSGRFLEGWGAKAHE